MLEASIVERLERLLSANPYHGDKILSFIRRHYTDILIIIPGNDAEEKNLKLLNEIALCEEMKKNDLPTSSSVSTNNQVVEKQLQCF